MKIYSKKTFWSGMFFLVISIIFIFLLINQFGEVSNGKIIKNSIYLLLSMLFGFASIRQSLSYEKTREAEKENDEREELINLKSSSTAINIVSIISWIFMAVSIILWYKTRAEGTVGMIVAFGIMFGISLFSRIFAYIYYNKKI